MSWDGLVAAALLGTERRRPQANGDAMLAGIDWDDPEGALLASAAVLSTARAAGARPPEVPAPDPAPDEELPLCSREADAVLARILAEQPELLEEWLQRAAARGLLAWPRRLSALLAEATYDRRLRGVVLRAAGRRGGWLAARSDDWSWATKDPADAEAWDTGSRDERLAMLQAVREQDAAAGRALVEATWESDTADERRAFLIALASGLSSEDEPLLERALDDRRKEVRRAAAELLARLPGSALARRMSERLAPLVTTTGTLRKRLEVELPEAVDASMVRDGLQPKGAPRGTGPRAWWLRQLVAAAPLAFWSEHLGLAPEQIARLAPNEMREGLVAAVAAQGDPEWAAAVADFELVGELPAQAAGAAVREVLESERQLFRVANLMMRTAGPWDADTSRAFVEALRDGEPGTAHWLGRRELQPLALQVDPALIDHAAAVVEARTGEGISAPVADHVLALLDLRHAIIREIP